MGRKISSFANVSGYYFPRVRSVLFKRFHQYLRTKKLNRVYKLSGKKEGRRAESRKNERVGGERCRWRGGQQQQQQQMELAGSLVGPSREIEVAFLRSY